MCYVYIIIVYKCHSIIKVYYVLNMFMFKTRGPNMHTKKYFSERFAIYHYCHLYYLMSPPPPPIGIRLSSHSAVILTAETTHSNTDMSACKFLLRYSLSCLDFSTTRVATCTPPLHFPRHRLLSQSPGEHQCFLNCYTSCENYPLMCLCKHFNSKV